nr:MAG TPA: hypothetical protein [Caudoviricetes sp.]
MSKYRLTRYAEVQYVDSEFQRDQLLVEGFTLDEGYPHKADKAPKMTKEPETVPEAPADIVADAPAEPEPEPEVEAEPEQSAEAKASRRKGK